jgi:hypothetical protein
LAALDTVLATGAAVPQEVQTQGGALAAGASIPDLWPPGKSGAVVGRLLHGGLRHRGFNRVRQNGRPPFRTLEDVLEKGGWSLLRPRSTGMNHFSAT